MRRREGEKEGRREKERKEDKLKIERKIDRKKERKGNGTTHPSLARAVLRSKVVLIKSGEV